MIASYKTSCGPIFIRSTTRCLSARPATTTYLPWRLLPAAACQSSRCTVACLTHSWTLCKATLHTNVLGATTSQRRARNCRNMGRSIITSRSGVQSLVAPSCSLDTIASADIERRTKKARSYVRSASSDTRERTILKLTRSASTARRPAQMRNRLSGKSTCFLQSRGY